jgi:holo-[acyl-carrier protein] synthase
MTIVGVGMDIVETKRIADSLERFGDRFLQRVFCEGEIAYAKSMKQPQLHLAARFAAKEAVSKAFGTGIGHTMGWRDIEIIREPSGQPRVVLHGKAEAHARERKVREVHISLSHTAEYGAASAVVVGE